MTTWPYAVVDLETTIKMSYKRKANPFYPKNWIVDAGVLGSPEEWGTSFYFTSQHESRSSSWFRDTLARTKLLVGHNIKFDIHHAIQVPENYAAWMDWIADGGQIWDTQLAEYLLNGMGPQDQYLALDEVAPRYGGNLKLDEVKLMWEDGIDTPDIPRELLETYLIGDKVSGEQGDLGNTRLIFQGQLAKARKRNQLKSILLNMGSLVYTIEAEHNGMAVDYELGLSLAKDRAEELEKLGAELVQYVPDDLPFEFNWGSRNHLSALIFGGQVKYVAKAPILDDDGNLTYYQKKVVHVETVDGMIPEEEWLAQEDPVGVVRYASGKKKGEPKTKTLTVPDLERGPKERKEDFYYTFPGFTKPEKSWQTKTPGVYSTAGEVIDALGNRGIPFLDTLSQHSAVSKDLKTYFITTDEKTGEKKGMLTLVDNGIIHHSLNHTSTVTGRFSSSNPNLQNLSGKGKSKVKYLFVSRYPDGKVIQSDFTSLEIYIQAILTGCRQLIADLKAGLDMHCLRVSQKERIPYEEAVLKCKGDEAQGIEPIPEWVSKRKGAKEFSFQRAYGAGVATIAAATGMEVDEVQALADAEAERYPEIAAYFASITAQIESSTRPTGVKVPHPDFPSKIVELGRGFHRTPDGKLYAWRQNPAPKYIVERSGKWASYSPPEIQNYEVQGGGAEWAKAAMWLAVRAFYKQRNFDGQAVLVNQVHDACYADAADEVAPKAAALLHVSMESASPFIEKWFNWPQPVYVPSDTTWGDSMADENRPEGMAEHVDWAKDLINQYI